MMRELGSPSRDSPSESDGGKVTVSYQQLSSVDVRNPAQLEMSI